MRFRAAAALFAVLAVAMPEAHAAPSNKLDYTVLRDGSEVGSHSISFERSGDTTTLNIATKIAVKVVFVTVYRFEHVAQETWKGDRLVSLQSKTNDDGTAHHVEATAGEGALVVNGDTKGQRVDSSIVPGSLWNIRAVKQSLLLNSLDGTQMQVSVKDVGDERIKVRGASAVAHHYRITGGLARDVWYDASQTLVRMQFAAKDNSTIVYELQ